jgi:hypothetical protein
MSATQTTIRRALIAEIDFDSVGLSINAVYEAFHRGKPYLLKVNPATLAPVREGEKGLLALDPDAMVLDYTRRGRFRRLNQQLLAEAVRVAQPVQMQMEGKY